MNQFLCLINLYSQQLSNKKTGDLSTILSTGLTPKKL